MPASPGVAPVDVLRRATLARTRRTTPSFLATRYSMLANPRKIAQTTPAGPHPLPGGQARAGSVRWMRLEIPRKVHPMTGMTCAWAGPPTVTRPESTAGEVGRHPDDDSHRRADQHDSVAPAFCCRAVLGSGDCPPCSLQLASHSPPLSWRYPEGRPPGATIGLDDHHIHRHRPGVERGHHHFEQLLGTVDPGGGDRDGAGVGDPPARPDGSEGSSPERP